MGRRVFKPVDSSGFLRARNYPRKRIDCVANIDIYRWPVGCECDDYRHYTGTRVDVYEPPGAAGQFSAAIVAWNQHVSVVTMGAPPGDCADNRCGLWFLPGTAAKPGSGGPGAHFICCGRPMPAWHCRPVVLETRESRWIYCGVVYWWLDLGSDPVAAIISTRRYYHHTIFQYSRSGHEYLR